MFAGLCVLALALPWLQPWAPAPAPSVPGLVTAWGTTGLLLTLVHQRGGWRAPTASTLACVGVLAGLTGLSLWTAAWVPDVDLALLGGLWGSVLCIFLAQRLGMQADMARPIAQSLLWVGLACAVMGCIQYAGLAQLPGNGFDWLHASPQRDAYANLRQRNQFGTLMALGLVAWFYLQPGWLHSAWWQWLQLLTLSIGAVVSCSRAGALSWLLVAGAAFFVRGRIPGLGPRLAPALAALLLVCFSLALPWMSRQDAAGTTAPAPLPALARAVSQAEGLSVCESRIVLWRNVLELSLQRPWTGWGWGELDYAMATQPLTGTRFCGIVANAHHLPLQLVAEWGWPLALALMLGAGRWLWRRRPGKTPPGSVLLGWGLLVPLGIHSLLEFPLWYGPFQMTLGLALGLLCGEQVAQALPAHRDRLLRGLGLLLVLGAGWGGWDYLKVSQIYLPAQRRLAQAQQDPWSGAEKTFWFRNAVDFAKLTTGRVPEEQRHTVAQRLVHFSPEPAVFKHLEAPITRP
jgi:Virulence factor membrane-bound polymerase, C-terminal/O-Antigen ligase/Protein glycosylation ligase